MTIILILIICFQKKGIVFLHNFQDKTRQDTSMCPFVHSTGQLIWTDVGLRKATKNNLKTQKKTNPKGITKNIEREKKTKISDDVYIYIYIYRKNVFAR